MNTLPSPMTAFYTAIGEAVMKYTEVEMAQATLLSSIMAIKHDRAYAIFYTIQNIRGRNSMIETLLRQQHGDMYEIYWESLSALLQKLARFRNAVAHWHPAMQIYMDTKDGFRPSTKPPQNVLMNPSPGWGLKSLKRSDLPPFLEDCRTIQRELQDFSSHLDERRAGSSEPLPEKFRKRVLYLNRAVLQRHRKPKAPQSRRRSSQK
jgi:hypothetical protein